GAAGAGRGYIHFVAPKTEAWHWSEMLRPLVDDSIPAADAALFWLACAERGEVFSPAASIEDDKRAIALYRRLNDRLGSYLGWCHLVYAFQSIGQLDEARHALDEALALRDPAWPPGLRVLIDNTAAIFFSQLGALDEARGHALDYLAVGRELGSAVDEFTALSILVDLDIAAGNVQEAAVVASEMLARPRASLETYYDGLSLRSLATALMSADRLDEAEPVYREALSRVRRNYGTGASVLYDVAMLLARRKRIDDAARVWAYAEGVYAAEGKLPRLVARQIRERLLALLAAERSPDTLSRLYDEGRRLTDDEACALAFPPSAPGA
ncbi:MAG: tetratricopeptide repeat protein, partial [Casimicrobiaceae bacterium]